MKKDLFAELVESIEEAGKIRKGLVKPSRVFRYRPVDIKRIRNRLHISTGSVTSNRESKKDIKNSSQLKVTDRKNAARIDGISIGTVTSLITWKLLAPRSRAALSMFF